MIEGKPLTLAEAAELDSYGELRGAQLLGIAPIAPRAIELWERELLYGSEALRSSGGIIPRTVRVARASAEPPPGRKVSDGGRPRTDPAIHVHRDQFSD